MVMSQHAVKQVQQVLKAPLQSLHRVAASKCPRKPALLIGAADHILKGHEDVPRGR